MATLALTEPVPSASESDLRLSDGSGSPSVAEADGVAKDVADVMTRAFGAAKLVHADQASLRLPIAYIQYRAYTDRRRYDWTDVLSRVFEENRNTLRRYSAHKGQVGFYKLSVP